MLQLMTQSSAFLTRTSRALGQAWDTGSDKSMMYGMIAVQRNMDSTKCMHKINLIHAQLKAPCLESEIQGKKLEDLREDRKELGEELRKW
ncbi:unnamed protein product [Sympodiomycopsis kandeliae]